MGKLYAVIKNGKLLYKQDDIKQRIIDDGIKFNIEYREIADALRHKEIKLENGVVVADIVAEQNISKKKVAKDRLALLDTTKPIANLDTVLRDIIQVMFK